eukprot:NODE_13183_length_1180_cov_4.509022.p7 GENE.NODE_13183_length_1180_cov_4.509022~~NODE_13183_length_1180_cov_4.509022.p7  ORF type:complete len:77 (+),score=43.44 NODE_13183_length_1180_cov_4.509022:839-1069(+)
MAAGPHAANYSAGGLYGNAHAAGCSAEMVYCLMLHIMRSGGLSDSVGEKKKKKKKKRIGVGTPPHKKKKKKKKKKI